MHLFPFPRFLLLRVITGLRLLHVSDSSVDRHLLQAPSQPHPALLRMGASHHCHGHQQVCVCVCNCVCVCLVFKGERTAILCLRLPVSGLLDDSSPKQIAAPEHIHPPVPLSLAASLIHPVGKDWLSRSLSLTLSYALLSTRSAGDPTFPRLLSRSKKTQILALKLLKKSSILSLVLYVSLSNLHHSVQPMMHFE